jgi:hypothetical protein
MDGTISVSVSDDIMTTTVSRNMKNNVSIQLTQEPAKPIVGKDTNFLINFINDKIKI